MQTAKGVPRTPRVHLAQFNVKNGKMGDQVKQAKGLILLGEGQVLINRRKQRHWGGNGMGEDRVITGLW